MPNPVLYYTNSSGDNLWTTLANWNTQSNGNGSNATSVPWVGGYHGYDLIDASTNHSIIINANLGVAAVTGTCSIAQITNAPIAGQVNSGTFSCNSFLNQGIIYGGVFNANTFYSTAYIHNGQFTSTDFTNIGYIYEGVFTVTNFTNQDTGVQGGSFFTTNFYNTGYITGGSFFTGTFYHNSNPYAASINGGTFFNSVVNNKQILSGDFSQVTSFVNHGAVFGGTPPTAWTDAWLYSGGWAGTYYADAVFSAVTGLYLDNYFNKIVYYFYGTGSVFTGISGDRYYENGVLVFTAPTVSVNTTIPVSLAGNVQGIGSYLPSYVGNQGQVLTTAQAAFIVAQTTKNKNPSRVITLNFAAGTYAGINTQSSSTYYPVCPFNIRITGAGRESTHLGGIRGWDVAVTGDKSINLGDIYGGQFVAAYLDSNNDLIVNSFYSGTISLTGCVANNVYAASGESIDDYYYVRTGFNGGALALTSCEINSAFAGNGGGADNGGTAGSGGGLSVTSDTVVILGAFSGYNNRSAGGGHPSYPNGDYQGMGQVIIDSVSTDYVCYPINSIIIINRGFGDIFYRNGYYGSGGYRGTHYTDGAPDAYSGISYDYTSNEVSTYYYNGQEFFDWYFTNYTEDGQWSTLANWNYPEGGGINPESVPWTEPITARQNLHLTPNNPVPALNRTLVGDSSGNWFINGTCDYLIAVEIRDNGFNITG